MKACRGDVKECNQKCFCGYFMSKTCFSIVGAYMRKLKACHSSESRRTSHENTCMVISLTKDGRNIMYRWILQVLP